MELGESVTQWLSLWRDGDEQAVEQVMALVYQDLRRLAAYYLSREANANTLQPTVLVHEAYLRIAATRGIAWQDRSHFIAVVSRTMRRILVDHARSRHAAKRDAALAPVPADASPETNSIDVLAVDEALVHLAERYPRRAQIVELRFFGGLEFSEIADALAISLATVERDWRFSRAWLQDRLSSN